MRSNMGGFYVRKNQCSEQLIFMNFCVELKHSNIDSTIVQCADRFGRDVALDGSIPYGAAKSAVRHEALFQKCYFNEYEI